MIKNTTIAAIASGTGIGGIGVIRVSGSDSLMIGQELTGLEKICPRHAHYTRFYSSTHEPIDEGILLYFKGPNSFTGEDVVEFHGHGGTVVLMRVLNRLFELGAIPAQAGEFSSRAFLNGKLDLIQAEAIQDLIMSQSEMQAKAAMNSLSGNFSEKIQALFTQLVSLRAYIEASIDFSEEDIDFISDGDVSNRLQALKTATESLLSSAHSGQLLTNGLHVVLAGKPNAGKSSILNALFGEERAIVTDIAGTTRDLVKETISIQGVPLHIIDTAGLRETEDIIELEGIRRTRKALETADLVLWIHDDQDPIRDTDDTLLSLNIPSLHIHNKADLSQKKIGVYEDYIAISAKKGEGITLLQEKILELVQYAPQESLFSARERHLHELRRVVTHLDSAIDLLNNQHTIELVAEEARLALVALGQITGEFTTEELLGKIFSDFCVGK